MEGSIAIPRRAVYGAALCVLGYHVLGWTRDLLLALLSGRGVRGKLVLVTGASQGLGARVVVQAAAEGATVLALARGQQGLEAVQREAQGLKGRVHVYVCDCADFERVAALAKDIVATHGCPDVLVHCAGLGNWQFLHEMAPAELRQCLDAPLFAAMAVTRAFLPAMVARNSGTIVSINSPAGHQPWPSCTAYACARWALRGLGEALRTDLQDTQVRVQDVVLGKIESNYFTNNPTTWDRAPPLARIVRPTLTPDAAAAVVLRAVRTGRELTVYPLMLQQAFVLQAWFPATTRWLLGLGGRKLQPGTSS